MSKQKTNQLSRILPLALAAAIFGTGLMTPATVSANQAQTNPPGNVALGTTEEKCKRTVAALNDRSARLERTKTKQMGRYTTLRKKWAGRLAYASQWAQTEGRVFRTDIEQFDTKVKAMRQEYNTQIQAFETLKKAPLDCSPAKRNELKKRIQDARQGHTKLETMRKGVVEHIKEEIQPHSKTMVTKMHAERRKDRLKKSTPIVVSEVNYQESSP